MAKVKNSEIYASSNMHDKFVVIVTGLTFRRDQSSMPSKEQLETDDLREIIRRIKHFKFIFPFLTANIIRSKACELQVNSGFFTFLSGIIFMQVFKKSNLISIEGNRLQQQCHLYFRYVHILICVLIYKRETQELN
jgi:hypothetical protein